MARIWEKSVKPTINRLKTDAVFHILQHFPKENSDLLCLDTSLAENLFKNTWHEKNHQNIQPLIL